MVESLSPEDVAAMDRGVRRYVAEAVVPAVERPEKSLLPEQLRALTDQAAGLGLLNLDAEAGLGLWEQVDVATARAWTMRCLSQVAAASASVALHLHQLALSGWLSRRLGVRARPSVTHLWGGYGVGRDILPRLLRGAALEEAEHAWLAGYFVPCNDCPLIVHVGQPVQALWIMQYDARQRALGVVPLLLSELQGEWLEHSHGMDDLSTFVLYALPQNRELKFATDDPSGLLLYQQALQLSSLGLCAIAVGVLNQAQLQATEYAALRVQAGVTIERHPAVQNLLGRAASVARTGQSVLDAMAALALGPQGLTRCMAAQAELLPQACAAANDALQVFGGLGYMRDNGIEKRVRDLNHLRLVGGAPDALRRFALELGRAA